MISDEVKLAPIAIEEKHILENLLTLFLHDLSEFADDIKVNEDGKFEYNGLELYFKYEDLKPFFICFKNEIAGFVFLNTGKFVPKDSDISIHELFILKAFRRKGVGAIAVKKILDLNKGKYKIGQLINNKQAINFWTNFYRKQGIEYQETKEMFGGLDVVYQAFEIH
jgi:predicted acetyltransferase